MIGKRVIGKRGGLGKKGQVTVFIIIGIVILLIAGGAYFARDYILKSEFEREQAKAAAIPEKAESVKEYIDGCVREVSDDAVRLIGEQGGYIEVPLDELVITDADPFSNSLEIFRGSGIRVPYWYYIKANGVEKLQVPSKEFIQNEIEEYINENLESCVNNFKIFREKGYEFNEGEVLSVVNIENNKVLVVVNWPIELSIDDFKFNFEKFYSSVDAELGKLYNLAKEIIEKENEEYFLEEKTLDMFVVYDEIPYSGIDYECGPRIWKKTDVINSIKNVLAVNIPHLKIKGGNYELKDSSEYFVIDPGRRADANSNFYYSEEWPFLIDIIPDDDVLKGESFTDNAAGRVLMQFFCLNSYHFVYSIKYPILISLSDESDYVFQFATQVVIDHNQPRRNRIGINQAYEAESKICENKLQKMKVYALGNEGVELKQLNNAEVSFKCANVVCGIGKTNLKENGEIYLEEYFPQCMNGLLIVEKEGYDKAEEQVTSTKEETISVSLDKFYEKKIEVKAIDKDSGLITSIVSNENVILQFENLDNGYTISVFYPEGSDVKLTSGNYRVSSVIMRSGGDISLPKQEIESCVDVPRQGILGILGSTEKKCVTNTIEESKLDSAIIGGAEFIWEVSQSELEAGNKIIFYTVRDKFPRSIEEMSEIYANIGGNSGVNGFLAPEIK